MAVISLHIAQSLRLSLLRARVPLPRMSSATEAKKGTTESRVPRVKRYDALVRVNPIPHLERCLFMEPVRLSCSLAAQRRPIRGPPHSRVKVQRAQGSLAHALESTCPTARFIANGNTAGDQRPRLGKTWQETLSVLSLFAGIDSGKDEDTTGFNGCTFVQKGQLGNEPWNHQSFCSHIPGS